MSSNLARLNYNNLISLLAAYGGRKASTERSNQHRQEAPIKGMRYSFSRCVGGQSSLTEVVIDSLAGFHFINVSFRRDNFGEVGLVCWRHFSFAKRVCKNYGNFIAKCRTD